ncbi:MAG: carbon-nitrogen hydrolase family protein [Butyrivibrio sp.]|nr:carbon-nitrogen hydrolase family protein [Butyrivibrio sp.]
MKDIITISTVTFNAIWGEKEKNLEKIIGYIEAAAAKGSNLVLLPEMALTGYDDEPEKEKKDKMQSILAETIPGPSTDKVAAVTKKLGIYCAFGMPERDPEDPTTIYNALAIFGPDGLIGSYRKIHLPFPEPHWATRGAGKPFLLDTPWGKIGLSICYDTYCFPEVMRYEGAMGARIHCNATALAKCHGKALGTTTVNAAVLQNGMYVVSSNLGGVDLYNDFWGGSSIIGPSRNLWETHYYAGLPFEDPAANECEMYTATIDLSLATGAIFKSNPLIDGATDFRPDKYIELYKEVLDNPEFGAGSGKANQF